VAAAGVSGVAGLMRSDAADRTSASNQTGLEMGDFLKLMVAQFQNQSLDSQVDSTQYITQLAQFSAIQAMNAMTQSMGKQYAASLVGKTVAVETPGGDVTGRVEGVNYYSDGSSWLVVGDAEYALSDVIQVIDPAQQEAAAAGETEEQPSAETSEKA
jgi:flagellar basal-body rod modification protein FlgD